MKSYIDKDGNLKQEPEGLEDELALRSPELSSKLDKIIEWKKYLTTYRDFLYDTPPGEGDEVAPGWEERLEKYNAFVSSQQGLAGVIQTLEVMKNNDRDEIGDKALVIQSATPLYYDLFMNEGASEAKAWIGTIKEHQVTNIPSSPYTSFDGKIRRRMVLEDAIPLSKDYLKMWVGEKITNIMFHDYTEGVENVLNIFNGLSGKETVLIHDTYENTDYAIIHHEMNEDEKQVADIVVPWRYNVAKHMPPRVPGLASSTGTWYGPGDSNFVSSAVGEDKRSLQEIYELLRENITDNKVKFFAGKQLQSILIEEDYAFIAKQPSPDRDKWLSKLYDERGLQLQNTTGINVWRGEGSDEKSIRKLMDHLLQVQEILQPATYHIKGTLSVGGWGGGDPYVDYSDIAQDREFLGYSDHF